MKLTLEVLRKNKLYAKLSKCDFWMKEVLFLGHIISNDGVSIDPSKIAVIMVWKQPKGVTEIRCFLGLAGIIGDLSKFFLP